MLDFNTELFTLRHRHLGSSVTYVQYMGWKQGPSSPFKNLSAPSAFLKTLDTTFQFREWDHFVIC